MLVGVNLRKSREAVRVFAQEFGITFPHEYGLWHLVLFHVGGRARTMSPLTGTTTVHIRRKSRRSGGAAWPFTAA
jgi:hypothetical protein